ncbi:hypothetical protein [Bifidobacterium sp. CP2]|uniref:hypothetical protein n=1 Tax=Bifidobacterium sp. CP2 TaxID=2809025 RepID=UPI003204C0A3
MTKTPKQGQRQAAMDERWARALAAKGGGSRGRGLRDETAETTAAPTGVSAARASGANGGHAMRVKPFKATGHKGGISRQGS